MNDPVDLRAAFVLGHQVTRYLAGARAPGDADDSLLALMALGLVADGRLTLVPTVEELRAGSVLEWSPEGPHIAAELLRRTRERQRRVAEEILRFVPSPSADADPGPERWE